VKTEVPVAGRGSWKVPLWTRSGQLSTQLQPKEKRWGCPLVRAGEGPGRRAVTAGGREKATTSGAFQSAPDWTRTSDLRFRRPRREFGGARLGLRIRLYTGTRVRLGSSGLRVVCCPFVAHGAPPHASRSVEGTRQRAPLPPSEPRFESAALHGKRQLGEPAWNAARRAQGSGEDQANGSARPCIPGPLAGRRRRLA
jgi:hypothetical protein